MGILEKTSRNRKRKKDLQRIVLGVVATAGVLGTALIAPNVIGAMRKLGFSSTLRQKESIAAARNRLLTKGFLSQDDRGLLRLTKQGEKTLEKFLALEHAQNRPKRWDGRWRVLIFDFPQRRGSLRNRVRTSLRTVGFVLLQRSVWIYPYDCEDFIALLKADFKIGKDMRYLIADSVEGDRAYRRHFGLK